MTKLDRNRLDKIEREEWRLCHPGWWQERALNILMIIVSVIIGIIIFYWCSIVRVTEVEAAVFHKEADKILYVERLDTTKVQTAEFLPKAIEVDNSSLSDSEAEIESSDMATDSDAEEERWESLGVFKTTGYCNCKTCCGKWAGGKTKSGVYPEEGITIAVDPKVIPLGSKVMIDGIGVRVAQDTGKHIKGKCIDVYYDDHGIAWNHGEQYHEVFVLR